MAIKTVQAIVNSQTVTLTLSDSGKYEGDADCTGVFFV